MRSRREYLALAVAAAVPAVTGCAARGSESGPGETPSASGGNRDDSGRGNAGDGTGGSETDDDGEDGDPRRNETSDDTWDYTPDQTHHVLTVPGPAGEEGSPVPHGLSVWNDASESRTIALQVTKHGGGSPSKFEASREVTGGGAVTATLKDPADYEVEIRLVESGARTTVRIDRERFDCNSSSTHVRVGPDGRFQSRVMTTLLACDADPVSGTPTENEEA